VFINIIYRRFFKLPLSLIGLMGLMGFMILTSMQVHAANDKSSVPPSAELTYNIKTVQAGIPISGIAKILWKTNSQNEEKNYSISTETSVSLFGKIHSTQSNGTINELGLAPLKFTEKRMRKTATHTQFDYANKRIQFSDSDEILKIKGGEQDRTSATWQLVSLAQAMDKEVSVGHTWKMIVAGNKDSDPWTFKVVSIDVIKTAMGNLRCLHILKTPPPDAKEQQLELWLATEMHYYPVQISFLERDGDQIDQKILSIKEL
jgi:hypothetical protein